MRDFQESMTSRERHGRTDAGQSDPYVLLCFAGDTKFKFKICHAFIFVVLFHP